MSTGSKALDRKIDEWLGNIKSGRLRLPSFQRGNAWDKGRVASMLDTILQDLPLGITLVLDVGDEEKFHSRPLESAPETSTKVTEHLLDGQQRLTALWRALKDNNEKVTYFVHVPELDDDPDNDDVRLSIRPVAVWRNSESVRYPRWVDKPVECLRQGLIPIRLLDPDTDEAASWVDQATKPLDPSADITDIRELRAATALFFARQEQVKETIRPLRETLKHYNLPYLRLPSSTPRDVALTVFVNMNTNAKPLKAYDIVVAELESQTGQRLHELVRALDEHQPAIRRYLLLSDAVLQTAALMQGRIPNQRGFHDLDLPLFVEQWGSMARGLERAILLLEGSNIFDAERIPSIVPLPVAAAILANADEHGDRRAVTDRLVRRYLWSAFFTSRYEKAAATRAAADHRAMRDTMDGSGAESKVPVLDRELYPLPTIAELRLAKWPKSKGTLSRAILAASTYFGARDFADDTRVTSTNIRRREYHHLFPDKLLDDAGIDSYLALNCALITWKTNRTIGRLDPIAYLEARADQAPDRRDVRDRLESHLVPYRQLSVAGPYAEVAPEALRRVVGPHFDEFLTARAELIVRLAEQLCGGVQPQLRDLVD